MAHNAAHNALVKSALEALAIEGYKAWESETGVWFEKNATGGRGRPHKFGKKGGGDITIILPLYFQVIIGGNRTITKKVGLHVEAEAKTGTGRQSPNQIRHQKFLVEPAGGVYILFRTVDELLCRLKEIAP
jgi:hypothetical protein